MLSERLTVDVAEMNETRRAANSAEDMLKVSKGIPFHSGQDITSQRCATGVTLSV